MSADAFKYRVCPIENTEQRLRLTLVDKKTGHCVANLDVVGREAAYIQHLSVNPEHRNQGLGGFLLAAALGWAETNGAEALTTSFEQINPGEIGGMMGFYQNNGFSVHSLCAIKRLSSG